MAKDVVHLEELAQIDDRLPNPDKSFSLLHHGILYHPALSS